MRRLFACEGFRGVVFSIRLLTGGLLLSLWTPAILVGPYKVVSITASIRYLLPVIPLSAAMLLPDWDAPGGLDWHHWYDPHTSVCISLMRHCMDGHICQCPACLLLLEACLTDFFPSNPDGQTPPFFHISVVLHHESVFDLKGQFRYFSFFPNHYVLEPLYCFIRDRTA